MQSAAFPLIVAVIFVYYCTVNAGYVDSVSRSLFFPIAAAAYSDQPELCMKNKLGSKFELVNYYNVSCDSLEDDCFSFLGLSHEQKAIVIGFRGTSSPRQLLTEGWQAIFDDEVPAFGRVKVIDYFLQAFQVMWKMGMKDDFKDANKLYSDYSIWISGHSLGGSMASIAALHLVYYYSLPRDRVFLYTYGQPRTGDYDFAEMHTDLVPQTWRRHHYWHHKTEIFYPDGMQIGADFDVCDSEESVHCSIGKFPSSIEDHIVYFQVHVSDFGKMGCVNVNSTMTPSRRRK
ncbi:Lipase domain containing protein [Aphelenchoides besseyi]|nr:Lipase domain containing protein [Aphelenchoides besseyi]